MRVSGDRAARRTKSTHTMEKTEDTQVLSIDTSLSFLFLELFTRTLERRTEAGFCMY